MVCMVRASKQAGEIMHKIKISLGGTGNKDIEGPGRTSTRNIRARRGGDWSWVFNLRGSSERAGD